MRRAFSAGLLAALLALQALAAPPAASVADSKYSVAALYNLANSYARAGKPGMAVLNYERAALLSPNDADIAANLQSVRSSAHVPVEPRTRLEKLAHHLSPVAVASVGVAGVLLAGFGILASSMFTRRRWLSMAVSSAGLVALGFTACNAAFWERKLHEAVVIAATTQMRATPVPMGDPLELLSEAATVAVTSTHEDFLLVRTPSGRAGWVARADLAEVVPKATAP